MYCMNARTCNDSDNIVHTHYITHDQVQCAINKINLGNQIVLMVCYPIT